MQREVGSASCRPNLSLHFRSLALCLRTSALPPADPLVVPASFSVFELSGESQKQLACQLSSWAPRCLPAGYVKFQPQTLDLPQVDHPAKPYGKTGQIHPSGRCGITTAFAHHGMMPKRIQHILSLNSSSESEQPVWMIHAK